MLSDVFSPQYISDFGAGLATRRPSFSIPENAQAALLNYRFEQASNNPSVRGGFTRVSVNNADDPVVPAPFAGPRLTSIFGFTNENGDECGLITEGDRIWKYNFDLTFTELTNGVSSSGPDAQVEDDTYWQWRVMNGLAVGVMGGDPVAWDGSSANYFKLGGSAPTGAWLVETWNSRMFMVSRDDPDILHYSVLGNCQDWSTTSDPDALSGDLEVGFQDGEPITGIRAWRNLFLIFKKSRIFVIRTGIGGLINTAASGWQVEQLNTSSTIGCTSPYTIQGVLDDVWFLSEYGVASAKAVQAYGDIKNSIVSDNIRELALVNKEIDTYGSAINAEDSEYWITVPDTRDGATNNVTWVANFAGGNIRWAQFDGVAAGSTLGTVTEDGRRRLWVGSYSLPDGTNAYRYGDDDTYSDDILYGTRSVYRKFLMTKPMTWDDAFAEKYLNKMGLSLRLSDMSVNIDFSVRYNENESKQATYPLAFTFDGSGGQWDVDSFSDAIYAAPALVDKEGLRRIMKNPPGNRCQAAQFIVENNEADVYYIIKMIYIEIALTQAQQPLEA